ncbi:MAG: response regulator [Actinomycetota bacterium]
MAKTTRVGLCDDHALVRGGLRRILDDEPDLQVVGEAGTAAEAVRLATEARPDVLVMDIGLPGVNGLEGARRVVQASPGTRVLMLTVHDDVAYLRQAFEAGAHGYLLKEAADVDLVAAVRAVAAGGQYVHPTLGAALLAAEQTMGHRMAGPGGELSERETQVLARIALGYTNAEIARELYLSVRTVETHRAHVHQKLGARTRAELVRFAREAGLLVPDPAV